jgi:hypothetical protein
MRQIINTMIGGFKEGESNEITLDIQGEVLEICMKYLHYKVYKICCPSYLYVIADL